MLYIASIIILTNWPTFEGCISDITDEELDELPKRAIQTLAFVWFKVYSRVKGTEFRGSEYISPLSEQTLWEFGRGAQ